jgi:cellobiose transport system permease protein
VTSTVRANAAAAAVVDPRPATSPVAVRRRRARNRPTGALRPTWRTYLLLAVATIVSVLPLYYTIVMASHTNAEMAAKVPPLLPNGSLFTNLRAALRLAPLSQGLINSLVVSTCVTVGTVAFCTLGGFAFAKLRFRGSRFLLAFCIGTMMVPTQMGIIPLYMLMARLGFAGHLQSVVLPTLVTAFGIYFMRQFIGSAVPDELIEAAFVDGAGTFRVFRSIVLPAVRPAMAVLAMLTFLTSWNDFFWPIIALSSQNPTIQVSFQSLASGYAPQQSVIMAGTLYGTIPVLVVFAVLGKHIVGGIMQGAIKG